MNASWWTSAILFLGVPTSVLSISWFRVLRFERKRVFSMAALALAAPSVSYLFFLGAVAWPGLLGRDYSYRRFMTININFLLSLGAGLLALWKWRRSPSSAWITASGLVLALLWFFILAIQGAV